MLFNGNTSFSKDSRIKIEANSSDFNSPKGECMTKKLEAFQKKHNCHKDSKNKKGSKNKKEMMRCLGLMGSLSENTKKWEKQCAKSTSK